MHVKLTLELHSANRKVIFTYFVSDFKSGYIHVFCVPFQQQHWKIFFFFEIAEGRHSLK